MYSQELKEQRIAQEVRIQLNVQVTFQANQGFISQVRKILNTVKINFTP